MRKDFQFTVRIEKDVYDQAVEKWGKGGISKRVREALIETRPENEPKIVRKEVPATKPEVVAGKNDDNPPCGNPTFHNAVPRICNCARKV